MSCQTLEQLFKKPDSQRAHRALALQMLYAIDRSDYQVNPQELTERLLKNYEISLASEDFAFKLVEGVLKNFSEIFSDFCRRV